MTEEDWMEKLQTYKESLLKLQYSDTETRLKLFYDDLIAANKGYINLYAKQTDQHEIELHAKINDSKVLPASTFKTEMEKALETQYNTGVYGAGKKVVERLLA